MNEGEHSPNGHGPAPEGWHKWASGNGDNPVSKVVEHALLKLTVAIAATLGPTVAGFLLYEIWSGVKQSIAEIRAFKEVSQAEMNALKVSDQVQNQVLSELSRRVIGLEDDAKENRRNN